MTLHSYTPWGGFNLAAVSPRNGVAGNWAAQGNAIRWPAVDIQELDDRFVITADLPGMTSEQVDITVENGTLTLSGNRERGVSESSESGNYRRERVTGYFERSFALPDIADTDAIEAQLRDGVLRVEIPKTESARARRIEIAGS